MVWEYLRTCFLWIRRNFKYRSIDLHFIESFIYHDPSLVNKWQRNKLTS